MLTFFIEPLKNWHLKNEYKNWIPTGGKYEYIKLFAIIGIFVLLIACINFMDLYNRSYLMPLRLG